MNTQQQQAIAALIEAIEAGGDLIGWGKWAVLKRNALHAIGAYNGSLDAAISLHGALLPGCSQYSIVTDPTCLCVKVSWWPDGLSGKTCFQGEGWSEANPARAWLIAIIKAYASQLSEVSPVSSTRKEAAE